jgi:hypothetical protein
VSTILNETHHIARKEQECDAFKVLQEEMSYSAERRIKLTYPEARSFVKARRSNGKIAPGQKYYSLVHIYDEKLCHFKAIPEIHDICLKHDLYEQE